MPVQSLIDLRSLILPSAVLRFRAILMTAFSFILGVIPLVIQRIAEKFGGPPAALLIAQGKVPDLQAPADTDTEPG